MDKVLDIYKQGTVIKCDGVKFTIIGTEASVESNIYDHGIVKYKVAEYPHEISIVNVPRQGNVSKYPFADDTAFQKYFFFEDEVSLSHELEGKEVVWIQNRYIRGGNVIAKVSGITYNTGRDNQCTFSLDTPDAYSACKDYPGNLQYIKPATKELLALREKYLLELELYQKAEKDFLAALGAYSLLNYKPYPEFNPEWIGSDIQDVLTDDAYMVAGCKEDDNQVILLVSRLTGKMSECSLAELLEKYIWCDDGYICGVLK